MFKDLFNRKKPATGVAVPTAAPTQSRTVTQSSTQSWMPVTDVFNGFMHRRDGSIITAIRIQPVNFELLSDNEKYAKIKSFEEVLNGIEYTFQIISIARPVDLDNFITRMEELKSNVTETKSETKEELQQEIKKINKEDDIRNRLLNSYMSHAAALATSGETVERQFYILLDQKLGKTTQKDEILLFQRTNELASNLVGADLIAHVCNDEELRDLLFIFTNSNQAAFERAPNHQFGLPPQVGGFHE
ncbi:hypothetical protein ACFOQM_04145 [Paenibacillus sp. GCM10012307]|uniref:TraC-like domain-containing protein n=1 Tax=Paenibacillus roseus TaxID=2798579 RepID=A0A934MPK5_9BACL|nr:hypothetical protein [Paenibacillus roseus]MBJ6360504.1 hypothetical protein [Paenibacillus roseus]